MRNCVAGCPNDLRQDELGSAPVVAHCGHAHHRSPRSPLVAAAPRRRRPPGAASPQAEVVPPAVTLPPALDRVLRDYESAWRDGDGQRLASLFTDDGFAVQSGSPIARGRDAIAKNITGPGGELQLTAYAYAVSGRSATSSADIAIRRPPDRPAASCWRC